MCRRLIASGFQVNNNTGFFRIQPSTLHLILLLNTEIDPTAVYHKVEAVQGQVIINVMLFDYFTSVFIQLNPSYTTYIMII
jgi:hypothetical protein